jgi:hypothetical protein
LKGRGFKPRRNCHEINFGFSRWRSRFDFVATPVEDISE